MLGHLADCKDLIQPFALHKLHRDIDGLVLQIEEKCETEQARHRDALAALKAEKAVPASKADVERLEAMWVLLRGLVKVAAERCAEAGYPPFPAKDGQASIGFGQ